MRPRVEGALEVAPVPGKVAVEVDATAVLPRVRGDAVRVEDGDDPECDPGPRLHALERARDRDPSRLVAVDAADDEDPVRRRRIADDDHLQRPSLDGMAEDRACRERAARKRSHGYIRSIIARPKADVETSVAPSIRRAKSYVTILSPIAASIEETIRSAASRQPRWRSIISAERISEP